MLRSRSDGVCVVGAFAGAVGALSLALCSPGSARAESAAPAPQLTWHAPEGCPDQEAVAMSLRDTLGSELASFGQHWQVQGQVRHATEGEWQLLLELREPEQPSTVAARQRVLNARRCEDLVEAAAVAVALALGDARELSAGEHVESALPPAPATPASEASPPGEELAASEAPPPARAPLPKSLNVSLEALLDTAGISGSALGGSLALGGWLGDFALDVHAVWLPGSEERIAVGQSAEFSLLAAGARLCYRLWGTASGAGVAACGGMEFGRFTAESHGLAGAGEVQDTWLAPSLGADLKSSLLGPLAVRSRLELLVPLQRQTYRVDLVEPIHEIPTLTVRWSLGVEADLPLP